MAAAALAACTPRSRPGLASDESRQVVNLSEGPWRAVGAIITRGGRRCTGALVGPRTVLTAGHCVVDRATRQAIDPTTVDFVLGLTPRSPGRRVQARSILLAPAFREHPDTDWALVTLEVDAVDGSPGSVLAMSTRLVPPGVGAVLGGYPADNPRQLAADISCTILGYSRSDTGRAVLWHSCNAAAGTSGGPLLVLAPDGNWLIAGVGSMGAQGRPGGLAVPSASILLELAGNGQTGF